MRVAGLILAGGAGRRMGGRDKSFLTIGGQTLIARAAARLGPQVVLMAVSANGDPGRFAGLGLPVLPDAGEQGQGPLAGILAGLIWAADAGVDALATVAVDTPFFPADMVARLGARATGGFVVVAETPGGMHPTCGLWPVGAVDALAQTLAAGQRRLRDAAAGIGLDKALFPDEAAFFNINAPDDLTAADARA